jgi:hypothetical protein
MSVFRRSGFIAIFVAIALVAGACGGDDSGGDAATTTTASATNGGSGSDATTTTTEAEPVSGDSGSTYCERIRATSEGDEQGLDFNFFNLTPDGIRDLFNQNLEVFKDWQSIAPDEIKEDAAVLVDAFAAIVDRGNELEWDINALIDDDVFNSFDDAAVTAASNNLDAYSKDVCGVDFTTISSDSEPPPPADVGDDPVAILLNAFGIPAGLISEDDIECLRAELGPEFEARITPEYELTTEDTLLLVDAVDACEIGLG